MDAPPTGVGADDNAVSAPHQLLVEVGSPCADCGKPIADEYLVCNGGSICPTCHAAISGSFRLALALGLGAALASIALFYAIYWLFDARFVFIAVIAGVLIGSAVRRGARASSLLRYRWLSLVLTYISVAATYAQALVEMPAVPSLFDAALRSLYLPLLMIVGQRNVVTVILLGFGLHEAWKFSAPPYVHVEGPFHATPAVADSARTAANAT